MRNHISYRGSKPSNLDTYLEKVFDNDVKFAAGKDVESFIQTGIEKIVKDLQKFVISDKEVQDDIKELKDEFGHDTFIDSLYPKILEVGSFYDDTKNSFPDEFDFVLVILHARKPIFNETCDRSISVFNNKLLKTVIWRIDKHVKSEEKYTVGKHDRSTFYILQFVDTTLAKCNGPNITLHFNFKIVKENEKPNIKEINVDIVPAIKVLDSSTSKYLSTICQSEEFGREVLETGSFLVLLRYAYDYTKISFIETEVNFMKCILSNRHRKVYRLLKYLIKGNLSEDEIRDICRHPAITLHKDTDRKHWISSYDIKTIIIHHHYRCTVLPDSPVSHCIVKILKWILKKVSNYSESSDMCSVTIQSLVRTRGRSNCYQTLFCAEINHIEVFQSHLSSLIYELKNLNKINDSSSVSVTPLSERYYEFLKQLRFEREKKHGQETIYELFHTRINLIFRGKRHYNFIETRNLTSRIQTASVVLMSPTQLPLCTALQEQSRRCFSFILGSLFLCILFFVVFLWLYYELM